MAQANVDKNQAIQKKKCITPEFRMSYPNLLKARAFEDQEAKFSVVMIFPKSTDLGKPAATGTNSMKAAVRAAIVEKWGEDKTKWPKNLRLPFRDGDADRSDKDGYENSIFVSASSKTQPGIVNNDLTPVMDEKTIYAGCYGRAELIAFAYDTKGNKGVSFSLQNVQKLRDGKPFGGRKEASEVFDAVESSADDAGSYSDDDLGDLAAEA